ncbi:TetR family transcriptional regulator [Arthrobacter sp. JZ12]|uniref:TetR/AcrR family transcriptional regulator n=1 Tax=Arthrobacter sp. JZ12 TaxID=2654190 RepID=UPI002B465A0B|nr:TetR/AcrR family transcriptional regulator [Arthrobacter sp. JZ12]WRH25872.1 TetR family transcriptional regulator [Arthrobacter sp. JZ12]
MTDSVRTPRQRARAQTIDDITRLGREHLAAHGAAALSLRAIARDLGLVSSAVYRYVKSRDDLLTLLVVDAYSELGDEVNRAVESVPEENYAGRFRALARAARGWAVREPARYALIFGSPVPGYRAPAEQTTEPGTRVIRALVRIYDDAYRAGAISRPLPAASNGVAADTPLAADLERIRNEMHLETDDDLVVRGTLVWASLFGAISFEVFGQYGQNTFGDPEQLFEQYLTLLQGMVGLGG